MGFRFWSVVAARIPLWEHQFNANVAGLVDVDNANDAVYGSKKGYCLLAIA